MVHYWYFWHQNVGVLCPPKILFGGGGVYGPLLLRRLSGEKGSEKGGQGRGFWRGMRVAPRSDMMEGGTIHSKL